MSDKDDSEECEEEFESPRMEQLSMPNSPREVQDLTIGDQMGHLSLSQDERSQEDREESPEPGTKRPSLVFSDGEEDLDLTPTKEKE